MVFQLPVRQATMYPPSGTIYHVQRGPQGSVLGPLLFNIYASDLADLGTAHDARLPSFADDVTLYGSSESPTAACDRVSSVLRRLKSCLDDRGLKSNSGKTAAMLISPSRSRIPTIDLRINLDGAEMKFVTVKQTRLLGIIIDDSLSSSIVNGDSGTLNYLMIIIAMSWLWGKLRKKKERKEERRW